jgi:adenosylcobinamide kinase/adenosylcobinamide-phosphate guanylyltransferase
MILVLGGAKSGKTGYAEGRASEAAERGGKVVYLASARAWDDEMKLRIRRHRESRPSDWITHEEPLDIPGALAAHREKEKVILFDCLTLWLTNLLMELGEEFSQEEAEEALGGALERFIAAAAECEGEIIVVSNLVELGLVAPGFMGRVFQEIAGRSHQRLASVSDEVWQVTAGLPWRLK